MLTVFGVLLAGIFSFSQPVFAQTTPPVTCDFASASGIGFSYKGDCAALLANYMVALNTFFYRLAIVLAVLMITIGGFQWLAAMGNASKISSAKETIEQAVIGLALAFTAYLIFSQIDQSFVKLESLKIGRMDLNQDCGKYSAFTCPTGICTVYCPDGVIKEQAIDRNCDKHKAGNQPEYCAKPWVPLSAECTNFIAIAARNNVPYLSKDSPELEKIRDCVEHNGAVNLKLDNSNIFTVATRDVCNYTRGDSCGPCPHPPVNGVRSCHYGKRTGNSEGSEAVDYNAFFDRSNPSEEQAKEQVLYNLIIQALAQCKISNYTPKFEGNHTHISTSACNDSGD